MNFKEKDWCFCEFKLQQIQKIKDGKITQVSDGRFSLSSTDLNDRCFPMSLEIKVASDSTEYWSNTFHSMSNSGLNYPDLNRKLIQLWVGICNVIEDNEKAKTAYQSLETFCKSVEEKVRSKKYETVDDFKIFK